MKTEDKQIIKEIEDIIKYFQSKIDELCFLDELAKEPKSKLSITTIIELKDSDGENHSVQINNSLIKRNCTILPLINDLMAQKRLLEIELNQLNL